MGWTSGWDFPLDAPPNGRLGNLGAIQLSAVLARSGAEAAAGVARRRGIRLAALLDRIDPDQHAAVIAALRVLKEAGDHDLP